MKVRLVKSPDEWKSECLKPRSCSSVYADEHPSELYMAQERCQWLAHVCSVGGALEEGPCSGWQLAAMQQRGSYTHNLI